MTAQAQNEAIAKWMGYEFNPNTGYWWAEFDRITRKLPAFESSLDWMHKAESKLRGLGGFGWTDYLRNLGHRDPLLDMTSEDIWQLACAPANKRAEALLLALKLWQP